MNNIMIDLETMGTSSNAAIVSIAAVEFDINTGEVGRVFYHKVDLQSCLNIGLTVEASTIEWWMKQADDVRYELFIDSLQIQLVLMQFRSFLSDIPNALLWGNSAKFDLCKLENAYSKCFHWVLWTHEQERDVRTFQSIFPEIKKDLIAKRENSAHNAINDCLFQIEYVVAVNAKLQSLLHNNAEYVKMLAIN